jgi:hypothetical protein
MIDPFQKPWSEVTKQRCSPQHCRRSPSFCFLDQFRFNLSGSGLRGLAGRPALAPTRNCEIVVPGFTSPVQHVFSSMYARTEGVRRLLSMYLKTSSSAYRMDPSNFTQEGPIPTLRQYRSVPPGTERISETALVVRSFIVHLCGRPRALREKALMVVNIECH